MPNKPNELLIKLQALAPTVQPLLKEALDLGVPKIHVDQVVGSFGGLGAQLIQMGMTEPGPDPEPEQPPQAVDKVLAVEINNDRLFRVMDGTLLIELKSENLRNAKALVEALDEVTHPRTVHIELMEPLNHPIDFDSGVVSIHNDDNAKWLFQEFSDVTFEGGGSDRRDIPGIYGGMPGGVTLRLNRLMVEPAPHQKACVLVEAEGPDTLVRVHDCDFDGDSPNHLWGIHFKYGTLVVENSRFDGFEEHGIYAHSPMGFACRHTIFNDCRRTAIQVSRRGTEPFFEGIKAHTPILIEDCTMEEIGPDGSAISIWGANDAGVVYIQRNSISGTGGGIYLGDEVVYNSISKNDKLDWARGEGYEVGMTNHGGLFVGPDADEANSRWKDTGPNAPARQYKPAHKRSDNYPIDRAVVVGNDITLADSSSRPAYSVQGARTVIAESGGPQMLTVSTWNTENTFLGSGDQPTILAQLDG